LYKLDQVIQGDLSEMIFALIEFDQAEKLAEIDE
jgi:protein subunit release factor A